MVHYLPDYSRLPTDLFLTVSTRLLSTSMLPPNPNPQRGGQRDAKTSGPAFTWATGLQRCR